ncbi:MAG: hypothetical protein ABIA63_14050 [bacterium]
MKIIYQYIIIFVALNLYGQSITVDYKVHNVGKFRQVVTNNGSLWPASSRYPGLLNSEYPLGANEEHLGGEALSVAAIVDGDTLVTSVDSWDQGVETWPTDAVWDTIWVVNRNEHVDIPYWTDYTGVSEQDFVFKYQDDFYTKITGHRPMHIEYIQRTMAWGFAPFDEFVVMFYHIMSKEDTLKQAYISLFADPNIGLRLPGWDFACDDFSWFDAEYDLAVGEDAPGGVDGLAFSPIGFRLYAPDNGGELKTTFFWYASGAECAANDVELYRRLSAGTIQNDQRIPVGSQFWMSKGPYTMIPGDTLTFVVVLALGEGVKGMYESLDAADWLIENNFAVPSPPPDPPLKIYADNHQVTLKWQAEAGEVNPEEYHDPNRGDDIEHPFEGYRVYKSTQGYGGPWTLLAQFDKDDNNYGPNTGIEREYTDIGLLNNVNYYYSVTAFALPDTVLGILELESSLPKSSMIVSPGPAPPGTVGQVAVVPNPYMGNEDYTAYQPPWESPPAGRVWMEQDRKIQFINLPQSCTIKIFTVSGELVKTLEHNDPVRGYEAWNLVSQVGQAIASDMYLFAVEDKNNGKIQVGKFVVIK